MNIAHPIAALALAGFANAAFSLDLNTGSQADLESIKGIGPEMSQRLIVERARRPFDDWEDALRRVPGLGKQTARRWSCNGMTVQGRPYPAAPPASAVSGCSR